MEFDSLLALSPLDGRYHTKLNPIRKLTSEYGLIYFRTLVEIRWLEALSENRHVKGLDKFSSKDRAYLQNILDNFSVADAEKIKQIEATTNHDVKAVEYFLREKLSVNESLANAIPFLHFACTSEDINNTAYALILTQARHDAIVPALTDIQNYLKKFAQQHAELPLLARTHGQPATPTTLGKEFANFAARLHRQLLQLSQHVFSAKFNGAVGNYNAHCATFPDADWQEISKHFIESLDLHWNAYTTQIEPHDDLAEWLQNLTRINTILIDFSRDIWGYISLGYFQQTIKKDEVGSSTMPHKVNPIDFENAEGNLGVANALATHLAAKLPISRWQRDLSDSTVMRNIGSVLGYSFLAYQSLLKGMTKLQVNSEVIRHDLASHWEVLAEPIQTVMRAEGIIDAYEQLKAFTRGNPINKEMIQQFIQQSKLSENAKVHLLRLMPETYLGLAVSLAKKIGHNN